jgi:hypothetical protein
MDPTLNFLVGVMYRTGSWQVTLINGGLTRFAVENTLWPSLNASIELPAIHYDRHSIENRSPYTLTSNTPVKRLIV